MCVIVFARFYLSLQKCSPFQAVIYPAHITPPMTQSSPFYRYEHAATARLPTKHKVHLVCECKSHFSPSLFPSAPSSLEKLERLDGSRSLGWVQD